MNNVDVFILFLSVRLLSVVMVKTWYVPDEYWQSLEVAHSLAFGYGYLTWEWVLGIRSYIQPLVIAAVYKLLGIFNLDNAVALIYIPRVLQAILSAYSDLCLYQWSGAQKWAILNITTSWFWFYTGSRTIINSLETALATIGLSYFPWTDAKLSDKKDCFIWLVALLCLIRPTAAILWLPLCIYHLFISKQNSLNLILKSYLPKGLVVLIFSVLVDSLAHGRFIVTSYEFLKANIFNNVGEWYGSQPWHWYLSAGFPAILGVQFLPFILATLNIIRDRHYRQNELALLGCIVFTLTIYSCLTHKEFRFILPLLPIVLNISSRYLSAWSHKANAFMVWLVVGVLLIGNVIPALYLSTIHQRGTLDVMTPLRKIATDNPQNSSFLFLMPCHSTPLYSHLHVNVSTRFLTCEPNFKGKRNYMDEADQFYRDPTTWLRKQYPPNGRLPSHIITFDVLVPYIMDILSRYKPMETVFYSNILTNERAGHYIVIHELLIFD